MDIIDEILFLKKNKKILKSIKIEQVSIGFMSMS